MAGTTFSGTFLSPVTLSNPALENPATITGKISVSSGTGLLGTSGTAWTIANQGTVGSTAGDGIDLASGGTVGNAAGGLIAGGAAGVSIYGGAGSVTNAGSITASAGTGIVLGASGSVTDQTGGQITGTTNGVSIAGVAGTVVNVGTITATGSGGPGPTYGNGIALQAGGLVTNAASGRIAGYSRGVAVYNNAGTVLNQGSIAGTHFVGVALSYGGLVSNAASGIITGGYGGIYAAHNAVSVVNYGVVAAGSGYGFSNGIALFSDATITNAASGTITGVVNGIAIYGAAGTVVNAGTIASTAGTGSAVALAAGQANLLVDDPGAVFIGAVDGGNGIGGSVSSTLELAAASLQGTLTGLGTQFVDFAQVVIDPGANWTLTGANTIAAGATFTNQATLLLHNATLSDAGSSVISATTGPAAVAIVDGKTAFWDGSGQLLVGNKGSGALTVSGQGIVSVAAPSVGSVAAVLGVQVGSEGWLNVTDVGSAFNAAGQLTIGQSGSGHLLVENQATVATGNNVAVDATQGFDVGQSASASGDVTVTGSKSLLSNVGRFIVGDAGFGSLLITHGGTVVTTPGIVVGLAGADIAARSGSDGSSVSVTGKGSDWQITGSLVVGNAASGSLAITAGGTVTTGAADIGVQASGGGNVSVSGLGSSLSLAGELTVGDAASAELSILSGATVTAANGDIGLGASAAGNVDIEGAGSRLDITGNLNIGGAGVGVLTLGNNTTLSVANQLHIGVHGVLNQFGGIIDPSTLSIDPGGAPSGGSGTQTYSVGVFNSGTLFANGTLTINTPLITSEAVGQTGLLEIRQSGNMVLNAGTVDGTQSVTFDDGTGILTIGTLGGFAGVINDFITGDQIILPGVAVASESFNVSSHVLTLLDVSHTQVGTLQFGLGVTSGTNISVNGVVPCFVAGTRISTEQGEVAVEDLREGERVQVLGGPAKPVVWIGHRSVDCARHPEPRKVWPVRIAVGAFGPGRPSRPLFLSPDHAVYVGDVLIPVKYLINGTSIEQITTKTVTYYHVELPEHAVLLAENLPTESYLDINDRANFVNGDGAIALYPDFASREWDARGCAPLVVVGPELDAARSWVKTMAMIHSLTHDCPIANADEMLPFDAPRTARLATT